MWGFCSPTNTDLMISGELGTKQALQVPLQTTVPSPRCLFPAPNACHAIWKKKKAVFLHPGLVPLITLLLGGSNSSPH